MARYLIALGSNVRHPRHGAPRAVLAAALAALAAEGVTIERVAPTITTAPLGPSLRRYANSAALIHTALGPPALLALLKRLERRFGRRRARRWSARVLDLDIILWSGGGWRSRGQGRDLTIPHPLHAERSFVLGPASHIAPHWRAPSGGPTLRQRNARLTRPRPLPKRGHPTPAPPESGP